ncbi:hypothetical protein BABINDRAFT_160832 [Babjeviella inositovora NRRL Y-12698]|uniref:RNA polymerase II transcription factor B subunit 2 n=1 Tax=Babjeviella inositovora NRRL Y-12698 TaxID=984486 RepID=A0A1E3QS99_9ASCO|nr:uncharacterized protein BABINDRAFT_160832 [Babjeviella inositovora NRRL Y-12698]ODQ80569.1 hypothetical protein BABINDRAFT_160832 [Babjeviella inositovora NRRL Y-12698]
MSSAQFKSNVNEYLEGLPETVHSRLYRSPATCLAIYRLIPPMAKFYIMSMVFNEKPVLLRDLDKWIKPHGRRHQVESLKRIRALHIVKDEHNGLVLSLNPIFRTSFRNALTGGETNNAFGVACDTEDNHQVDLPFLDTYAANKWETILHYMVGTELNELPSDGVLQLLKHAGLMEGRAGAMSITKEGFQFLLQDVNAQIWTLLLQYLRVAESLQMDPVDVLNFIFMLGSLELGRDYSLSALSETQIKMLEDLRDYGLVYQRKSTSRRFYPTRLATTLTSESMAMKTPAAAMKEALKEEDAEPDKVNILSSTADGSVIIETNFKLYAYTTSPLLIAILNLFVHLKTRFANMICGQLTRESVRHALYNGITAEQIILFLENHAHPRMRRLGEEKLNKRLEFDRNNNIKPAAGAAMDEYRLEILPPTVVDQIKLWQLEMDRIQTWDGYCFSDFSNVQEFELLNAYAEEIGVLLWSDKNKKKFFITKEGRQQVVEYANRKLRKKR